MNTCAWCGAFVATESPAILLSLRVKSAGWIDRSLMREAEGRFVWLIPKTFAQPLPACVPTSDCPARTMGVDFGMMCCSDNCASEARAALLPGFDVHDIAHHTIVGFGESVFLDSYKN